VHFNVGVDDFLLLALVPVILIALHLLPGPLSLVLKVWICRERLIKQVPHKWCICGHAVCNILDFELTEFLFSHTMSDVVETGIYPHKEQNLGCVRALYRPVCPANVF
jgi:hypothetical protein